MAAVSGPLGHADVTTTTHFYVHPRDEAMRNAMRGVAPVGKVGSPPVRFVVVKHSPAVFTAGEYSA